MCAQEYRRTLDVLRRVSEALKKVAPGMFTVAKFATNDNYTPVRDSRTIVPHTHVPYSRPPAPPASRAMLSGLLDANRL